MAIMMIPNEFKIRKKADVNVFINKCLITNNRYALLLDKTHRLSISKDNNNNISITLCTGDLHDIFNPAMEIARTNNNPYKVTVEDCIWRYRKYINHEWFTERRI